MATRVHQGQHFHHPQPAFEPESFTPQRQSRANGNGNGGTARYRRTRSPDHPAEVHFYSGSDEPPSPSKEAGLSGSPGRGAPQRSSRPSSMANANAILGRGKHADLPSTQGLPPSYPGDEAMDDRPAAARAPPADARRRAERQARRTSNSGPVSGAPPPPNPYGPQSLPNGGSPRGPSHGSSPRSSVPDGRRSPPVPQSQHLAAPPGPQSSDISRLSSPSINQSVLQPLEKKMKEYRSLMADAEADMTQLDEELRVLQERRRQAEERFVDARGRHDEYERQHGDVEKALRGEFSAPSSQQREPPQQVQIQPGPPTGQQRPPGPPQRQSWTMARAPSIDSFDDRPGTGQSMASRKKKGNRFGIKLW